MKELTVGIVTCASMREQVEECLASLEGSFRIYPIIPSCTFSVKIELLRHYLDRSTSENDVTLLAYGICHPQLLPLLAEYGDHVVRISGSNCYEMFLGSEKYAEYHKKCYWMLNKPFFTKWKNELLTGFGAGTSNGRMLLGDTYKKLLYVRFEQDELSEDLVEDFAQAVGLEYEIHSADTANLKRLLEEALATAYSTAKVKVPKSSVSYPRESEMRTMIKNIGEVIYKVDVHTKQFTFVSPQVKKILGYTPAEFFNIMNDYLQIPFYHQDDRQQAVAGRYEFLAKCLNEGMQEPYEAEYRAKHKNGDVLSVRENIYPSYSPDGIIESFVGKIADITERKRAEEQLLMAKAQLEHLLTSSPAVLYTSKPSSDYAATFISENIKTQLGYEPHEFTDDPAFWVRHVHPKDVQHVLDELPHLLKKGHHVHEYRFRHKDGTYRWMRDELTLVRDAEGNPLEAVGYWVDITRHKRAEEALRKSEEKYRHLIESIHDGIWVIDKDAYTTFVNPRMAEMLGYTVEEMLGKHLFSFMDEHGVEIATRYIERRRQGIKEQHEFEFLRKDGTRIYAILETSPLTDDDGSYIGSIASIQDITERKRAEEELKSSRDYLKKLTDSMWDAVFSVKMPERVIEWANDSFRITGYEPEECIGKTTRFLYPNKKGFLTFADRLQSAIAEGKDVLDTEQLLKRKNGELFPAEITTTFFREKGKLIRVTSIIRDITERKKLDQLKDDFISLVSHELRSPLTVITGAVNTVLTEGARLSSEETRQLLQDTASEADSLSHLLGNLLELSRAQADRLFLYPEAISLKKLIQDTVEEIKCQSSVHQFIVHLPRKLPSVYADQLRLERILYNLLENAVKYSPQGGEIRVSVKPEKEHLVIGVSDQGVGISPSNQAKLFEPFQRLDDPRLRRVGGVGLGLLVCRRLVEAHGGQIWIESELGRGSTFFFTMPLSHS